MKQYIEKYVPSEKNNSNSSNKKCSLNYMWVAGDTKWGGIFKLISILILRETELVIFLHINISSGMMLQLYFIIFL